MNPECIPEGAVKVHLYNVGSVLMPRGSMKKESLGQELLERLSSAFESWTDRQYGDYVPRKAMVQILKTNFKSEMDKAWNAFLDKYELEE